MTQSTLEMEVYRLDRRDDTVPTSFNDIDVTVGSFSLPCVTSCRDLALLVCSTLSHSAHVANVINIALHKYAICYSRYHYFENCIYYLC